MLLFIPAAWLVAQTPPPAASPAQQAPKPPVTIAPAPPPQTAPQVPPDKVIITVGDRKITAGQFDQIADSLVPEQYRAAAKGPNRAQFADNLVRMMILASEARRQKLDESPAYKTAAQFQAENLLASLAFEQINKNTKPDEATLRKYYEEHQPEFEQVHARHILIRAQGSPVSVKPGQKDLTDAEALAKAQELRKRLLAGEDFGKLATAESDDAGSGANGGDLGTFGHGQMVPSFEQAAFGMKPGELSEPIKTQFGYHIIKVESKAVKTFEEMRPQLERQLGPQQAQKTVEELVKKTNVTLDPEYFPAAKPPETPATPPAAK